MTDADLAKIETELDIELPDYYRAFVQNYPPLLLAIPNGPYLCELSNSAENVIQLNRLVRTFNSFEWPDEYLVIGESGCGDYYAIDIDDEDSSVYLWNHEQGDFSDDEEVDSLPEFAGQLIQSYESVAKHQRDLARAESGLFGQILTWWRNRS